MLLQSVAFDGDEGWGCRARGRFADLRKVEAEAGVGLEKSQNLFFTRRWTWV